MDDCVFCQIISGKLPAHIVDETENLTVFLSLENHPLIVPKLHVPDIFSMTDDTAAHIAHASIRIAKATKAATNADGIYINQTNGEAAGQSVFHYHMHVYPKWLDGRVPLVTPASRLQMMHDIRNQLT